MEAAMMKVEDDKTGVHHVHQGHQAPIPPIHKSCAEALWHWCGQGQSLPKPGEEEKAFVQLAPDCGALDVTNKIGII